MLKDLLKEVVALVAGKQAEDIVDLLDEQKYVNEFIIAKKLDLTINQVRNILYKISDYGLVSSTRKKDKRKGWYTYFWKIEVLKTLEFLRDTLLKKIDNIQHQIKSRETKRFYVCDRCHIEMSEENALLHDFTCNECGALLVLKDNTKMLRELKKNQEKIENDLKIVNEEIDKEREKDEKKKEKERKKIEKEKQKARKAKRNARKEQKNKTTVKKTKKPTKIKKKKLKTKPKKSKKTSKKSKVNTKKKPLKKTKNKKISKRKRR